ncbi:MAG TPA: hypothetical protein VIU61_05980, partial [Kofleriaceae bacterium]
MGVARVLVAALVVGLSSPAHADVLVLYGDLHAGGMYGKGLSGDQKDSAFFGNAPNGVYGLSVAARLLFLGAQIQHHQYTDGSDLATWSQITAGIDIDADLGSEADKKAGKSGFFTVGIGLGFGLGTGQQVDPPLSNDEVTDKGFFGEARIGIGKHLNTIFDIGLMVPVQYGYYFKNGDG